jgi:hypothetical protein
MLLEFTHTAEVLPRNRNTGIGIVTRIFGLKPKYSLNLSQLCNLDTEVVALRLKGSKDPILPKLTDGRYQNVLATVQKSSLARS